MSGSNGSRVRSEQVLVRLTPAEAEDLAERAAREGMTKPELVRQVVLRGDVQLMGGSEAAKALGGLTKQQMHVLSRKPGFPEPLARLANGPVWDAADIHAWKERRDRAELSTRLRTAVDGVTL